MDETLNLTYDLHTERSSSQGARLLFVRHRMSHHGMDRSGWPAAHTASPQPDGTRA
jgi:hypothetical protein